MTRKTSTIKQSEETLFCREQDKNLSAGSNSANIHAFGNVGISSNHNSPIDVYSFNAKWTNRTRIELVGLVGKN